MEWLESLGLFGLFLGNILSASVVPITSTPLLLAALAVYDNPVTCLIAATAGSWVGSLLTYGVGRIGKWEWIEKWFKVKPETLEKQKVYIDKYGIWLGLLAWVPFIGDALVLALGFYKARLPMLAVLILIGKTLRNIVWTLVYFGIF